MLPEVYIEALLVDEYLADMVGEALDLGLIDDELAAIIWLLLAASVPKKPSMSVLLTNALLIKPTATASRALTIHCHFTKLPVIST